MQPGLRVEGVTKSFPGVKALKGITFGVPAGTVHGLLGENGAGKSTLIKILGGDYRADGGGDHARRRSVPSGNGA